MYKICMNCGKKYDLSEKKCHNRKCPECGGKMKTQYSEEELKEIQKQNDDMVVINNPFCILPYRLYSWRLLCCCFNSPGTVI